MNREEIGFQELPEWLEDFSLELVQELNRLVRAFGVDDPQVSVRRYRIEEPQRVSVSVALTPHSALMISNRPGIVNMHISYVRRFGADGNSYVVWERGITVEAVRVMVSELRALRGVFGPSVEQALGELENGDNQADCKHLIDETFRERGYIARPLVGTAEDLLATYDRPDELMVFEALIGHGVIRRRDEEFCREREMMVGLMLESVGITAETALRLAPGELQRVYAIVGHELNAVFDQK